jgi:hypothetical protein
MPRRKKTPEEQREYQRLAAQKYRAKYPEKARASSKKWKLQNPDRVKVRMDAWFAAHPGYWKNSHLKANYGITLEQWKRLWDQQGNVCVLCKRIPKKPSTDHGNGFLRGILCTPCNTALGKFQHDPRLLRLAADYLEGKITTFIKIERNN